MHHVSGKWIVVLLSIWFIAAAAISASGLLTSLRAPAPQIIIVMLTLAVLAGASWIPGLRRWVDCTDVRAFVALHITRLFAGIYFLVVAERGVLPRAFAWPAGYGDIAVGLTAIVLIAFVPSNAAGAASYQWWYRAWNLFGLADILMVVGNAARVGVSSPISMAPLLHLPLSVLPTFLVPLIIATHVILFRRLR
jgi:hypothetical protein